MVAEWAVCLAGDPLVKELILYSKPHQTAESFGHCQMVQNYTYVGSTLSFNTLDWRKNGWVNMEQMAATVNKSRAPPRHGDVQEVH